MPALDEIKKLLNEQKTGLSVGEGDAIFAQSLVPGKGVSGALIQGRSFYRLRPPTGAVCTITAVDGGNAMLLATPSYCLDALRVAAVHFKDTKCLEQKRIDAYIFTKTVEKDSSLVFAPRLIPTGSSEVLPSAGLPDAVINPFDQHFMEGIEMADIRSVAGLVRRTAELSMVCSMIKNLEKGSMVLLDGTLFEKNPIEKQFLSSLLASAKEHGIIVAGISKTSKAVTLRGRSVPGLLKAMQPSESWYYYPCLQHETEGPSSAPLPQIAFARLHPKSRHVFRIDLLCPAERVEALMQALSVYATDPVFFGYPYPLIRADQAARISNSEAAMLRTRLGTMADLSRAVDESAFDAHGVLDRVRY